MQFIFDLLPPIDRKRKRIGHKSVIFNSHEGQGNTFTSMGGAELFVWPAVWFNWTSSAFADPSIWTWQKNIFWLQRGYAPSNNTLRAFVPLCKRSVDRLNAFSTRLLICSINQGLQKYVSAQGILSRNAPPWSHRKSRKHGWVRMEFALFERNMACCGMYGFEKEMLKFFFQL